MRIKNTNMRIKFLLLLICFILPFTEHAYFSGIYKEIFLPCDVTRLLDVVVLLLAFEPFNLGSGSHQNQNFSFLHKRNKLYLQSILVFFVWKFLQSF